MKKAMENPGRLKKAQKACSAMLASRLHVQLSLRARISQVCRSMLGASKIFSPPNGGFRACGKDTHHRDSASGDGANSARGLAKGVSEHLEGGIWEASEKRESNCSGVQLAERGDEGLLMLPFCWKSKMEIFGRRWREAESVRTKVGARAGGCANQGRVRGFAGVGSRRRLNNFPRGPLLIRIAGRFY